MTGAWTMTENGEFVLNEPYASKLDEAKTVATHAWTAAMMEWLSNETGYDKEDLLHEFVRRAKLEGRQPMEIVDSFVIEALEGNLR